MLPYSDVEDRDLPAQRRRRTRIIRTIDGFRLVAAMSIAVPVVTLLRVVGGGIIGAGGAKQRASEENQDEFPFPEVVGVVAALGPVD